MTSYLSPFRHSSSLPRPFPFVFPALFTFTSVVIFGRMSTGKKKIFFCFVCSSPAGRLSSRSHTARCCSCCLCPCHSSSSSSLSPSSSFSAASPSASLSSSASSRLPPARQPCLLCGVDSRAPDSSASSSSSAASSLHDSLLCVARQSSSLLSNPLGLPAPADWLVDFFGTFQPPRRLGERVAHNLKTFHSNYALIALAFVTFTSFLEFGFGSFLVLALCIQTVCVLAIPYTRPSSSSLNSTEYVSPSTSSTSSVTSSSSDSCAYWPLQRMLFVLVYVHLFIWLVFVWNFFVSVGHFRGRLPVVLMLVCVHSVFRTRSPWLLFRQGADDLVRDATMSVTALGEAATAAAAAGAVAAAVAATEAAANAFKRVATTGGTSFSATADSSVGGKDAEFRSQQIASSLGLNRQSPNVRGDGFNAQMSHGSQASRHAPGNSEDGGQEKENSNEPNATQRKQFSNAWTFIGFDSSKVKEE
eukprot:GHVT01047716.1.p1 GENE.GHVT01047716.1~~GHVT01047716.1.p1  ORF type:complete len:473 (+),score=68.75 GHVT01047716.1:828-2246(+)